MASIRVILGLTAKLDLEIEKLYVKTLFLHGDQDKQFFIEQLESFVKKKKNTMRFI